MLMILKMFMLIVPLMLTIPIIMNVSTNLGVNVLYLYPYHVTRYIRFKRISFIEGIAVYPNRVNDFSPASKRFKVYESRVGVVRLELDDAAGRRQEQDVRETRPVHSDQDVAASDGL